ncbi:2-succinyl-6-hydroxy-2,4-cyclohexadiene-1-carboxylate synthase [Ferdinandcohnia sp. Marseille-Q9671]
MFISSHGVNYHVKVVGNGMPLLFLHGFTGSISNWKQVADSLKNHYTCVLIDIIGHGKTDSPTDFHRYSIPHVAQDIIQILDQLDIPKVTIVGYSMGGRLALATAILHQSRVENLILESSSPGLRTEEERFLRLQSDEQLARQIVLEGIKSFVDYWETIPLFSSQRLLSKEKQLEIRKQRLRNNPKGLANSLRGMGTGAQPSYWHRLSELSIPTLLLCGGLDSKFCNIAEQMNSSMYHASVKKIKNAGHAIHVEQPDIFGKIVNEFVFDQQTV